jgi:hypothetical protein
MLDKQLEDLFGPRTVVVGSPKSMLESYVRTMALDGLNGASQDLQLTSLDVDLDESRCAGGGDHVIEALCLNGDPLQLLSPWVRTLPEAAKAWARDDVHELCFTGMVRQRGLMDTNGGESALQLACQRGDRFKGQVPTLGREPDHLGEYSTSMGSDIHAIRVWVERSGQDRLQVRVV